MNSVIIVCVLLKLFTSVRFFLSQFTHLCNNRFFVLNVVALLCRKGLAAKFMNKKKTPDSGSARKKSERCKKPFARALNKRRAAIVVCSQQETEKGRNVCGDEMTSVYKCCIISVFWRSAVAFLFSGRFALPSFFFCHSSSSSAS